MDIQEEKTKVKRRKMKHKNGKLDKNVVKERQIIYMTKQKQRRTKGRTL